ncbi:hypothetical protein D3C81_1395830 [compost metagenome]
MRNSEAASSRSSLAHCDMASASVSGEWLASPNIRFCQGSSCSNRAWNRLSSALANGNGFA